MPMIAPLLLSLLAAATPAPKSNLVIEPCQVGDRQQFETTTCDISLHNSGDTPITISRAEAFYKWDSIAPGVVVPPHGAAYLKTTVSLRDRPGFTKHSFRFATSEPGLLAQRAASVHGFVSTVLDQTLPTLAFGVVKASDGQASKELTLSSREVADFRILGVESKPDYLDVTIGTDGRSLHAMLKPDTPWGLLHGVVVLKINAPQQPLARVEIEGNLIGEVAPNGNPFAFGLMRTNAKNEFLIRLTSASGKDFKIGSTKLDQVKGKVDVVPCIPAEKGCRILRVLIDNKQQAGKLQGKLLVDLPDFKRTLPIEVVGMLLPPQMKVHDLNKELEEKQAAAGTSSPVEAPEGGLNLKQEIRKVVENAEQVPPPGNGPLLRWAVANDAAVHGYIIYRADAETGPFLRVNKELIRSMGEPSSTSSNYQWRDTTAVSGHTYWYEIGMEKSSGEKAPLSAAQKVTAK